MDPLVVSSRLRDETLVSLPTQLGTTLAAALAGANASARQVALDHLATWFPGYDFGAAAQTTDDRRFTVLDLGPALADHLDAPAAVERMLREHELFAGVGGMTFSTGDAEGHQLPPDGVARPSRTPGTFRPRPGPLVGALSKQWTSIINGADRYDAQLSMVCGALETAVGCPVNTNCYLSFGAAEGFGAHWDTHDTLIVQVAGAKAWSVFPPTRLSAQKPWVGREVAEGDPIWSGVLEVPLALVIPRGWGHRVEGSDDLSIHYTFGLNRIEIHELLRHLAREVGHRPEFRADVPFDPTAEVTGHDTSFFDTDATLARTVARFADHDAVSRAVAGYRSRLPMRIHASLTEMFAVVGHDEWDGVGVRVPAPVGVMVAEETDEGAVLAFDGAAVTVAREALDAFVELASGRFRAPESLPPVTVDGIDRRRDLCRQLVELGLADVAALSSPR